MPLRIRHITIIAMLLAAALQTGAQEAADTTDRCIREAPQIECGTTDDEPVEIPSFIHSEKNRIDMNGADWQRLKNKIASIDSMTMTVVHIGDSHIQADFATGKTRALMQSQYGSAGRGLIVPLKLAGTNEPRDYLLKSTGQWYSSKLLKPADEARPGFTGIGISPAGEHTDLTVATLARTGSPEPFGTLKIYHSGKFLIDSVASGGEPVSFSATYTDTVTTVRLPEAVTDVTLSIAVTDNPVIYGIVLTNGKGHGILYHAIGNNGATYRSYNLLPDDDADMRGISPDLVIVSLGANEAFSRMTPEEIRESIDTFVNNIRRRCPSTQILLTTPMECQKSSFVRGRKRRRGRRVYAVNEKVATVRGIILDYAATHSLPVYDWYEVAGGAGASRLWNGHGLMAKDRIHNSYTGYRLHGTLFYEALNNALR